MIFKLLMFYLLLMTMVKNTSFLAKSILQAEGDEGKGQKVQDIFLASFWNDKTPPTRFRIFTTILYFSHLPRVFSFCVVFLWVWRTQMGKIFSQ